MEYILYKMMFLPSHYVKTNINIVDVKKTRIHIFVWQESRDGAVFQ